MHWSKVEKKWQERLGKTRDGDVSWTTEQWAVPGEEPLEIRVCTREGVDKSKYCEPVERPRTSIVLHQTEGYGQQLAWLMGGAGHPCSAHFQLGRCGTPYQLVPTELTAWHATWWNGNSIGIEIDCIGELYEKGDNLVSQYGNPRKDVYCAKSDKGVYVEKEFSRTKYWASLTEKQYLGLGRLIKAICFKHKIPRILLPEPQRYQAFDKKDPKVRRDFRGICTHLNIDPARKVDIGPYLDWPKVIQYAGLTEADCFHPPAIVIDTWKNDTGGAATAPASPGGAGSAQPKPPAGGETLPAPVMIDNHTLRVHVGSHGGRICFSVKQPGDPLPTTPDAGEAPAAKAPGKRDEFIQACLNFLGAPYKSGSRKPDEGIDGAGMIALALRRVELFKSDDEMPKDAEGLSALWHVCGANPREAPPEILPGDLVWFGKGSHETDPLQHPMVYLGGGRALGPVPDAGASSAVQIIAIEKVPENFAGWMHVDDLGDETKHSAHPGEAPAPGAKLTGALLPAAPAARYDALKKLVQRAKGKWEDGKEKINLVGVKNLHDRCQISPAPDGWNDTLFAAFLDKDGHKCCLELRASLNPGSDENRAESWQLWEGSWKFKLVEGEGVQGKALQPDGKVKGWHDVAGMGSPRPVDHDVEVKAEEVQPGAPKGDGKDKPPAPKKPIEAPSPTRSPPRRRPPSSSTAWARSSR